jgi:hypothetical protein
MIEITGEQIDIPDDSIQLPEPQIINVSPTGEEDITNKLVTIRASLLASTDARINEDSIEIKVDDRDVTAQAKFNRISDAEHTLIYQTEQEYEPGLHKVDMTFTDSEELDAQKSWTFNIETEQRDADKFYIFGYGISKIIAYVILGGLLLLILALIVPIILVKVWKEDEDTVERDDTLTPPQPTNTVENIVNQATQETTFTKLDTTPLTPQTTTPEPYVSEQPTSTQPPVKEKAGGDIKKKIIEAKKQRALEEQNSGDFTAPTTAVEDNQAPDPTEDLQLLYEKIEETKEKEQEPTK